MNIYGNDGNLIFGENNYEIIESYNDSIKIKTSKNGIYIVKLSFCDGMDVKVLPNEIYCEKADEDNTVTIGGKVYHYVTINGLDWITENLALQTEHSMVNSNAPTNYGLYYKIANLDEVKAQIPSGWRIPTTADRDSLTGSSTYPKYNTTLINNYMTADAVDPNVATYFKNCDNSSGLSLVPNRIQTATTFDRVVLIVDDNSYNALTIQAEGITDQNPAKKFQIADFANGCIRLCRTHV